MRRVLLLLTPLLLTACPGQFAPRDAVALDLTPECSDLRMTVQPGDERVDLAHPCADAWWPEDGFGAGGSFTLAAPLPWWLALDVVDGPGDEHRLRARVAPNAPGGLYTYSFVFERVGLSLEPAHGRLVVRVKDDFRHTVELATEGRGHLEETPCGLRVDRCRASFPVGERARAVAKPEPGHHFVGWVGCIGGAALERAVDAPWRCTARFAPGPGAVEIEVEVEGAGAVEVSPARCIEGRCAAPAGTALTLTALPDPGHAFAEWVGEGACRGTSPRITVQLAAPMRCRARFAPAPTLTVEIRNQVDALVRVISATGAALQCQARAETVRCSAPIRTTPVQLEARTFGDVAVRFTWSGDCRPTSPVTAEVAAHPDPVCVLQANPPR